MMTATGRLVEGGGRREPQKQSIAPTDDGRFVGTANPRHLRALNGLLRRPMPREHIDFEAGCSNGPDLITELRRRGLEVPCTLTPVYDRDGREVKRGIYHLTPADRRKLNRWMANGGGAHG